MLIIFPALATLLRSTSRLVYTHSPFSLSSLAVTRSVFGVRFSSFSFTTGSDKSPGTVGAYRCRDTRGCPTLQAENDTHLLLLPVASLPPGGPEGGSAIPVGGPLGGTGGPLGGMGCPVSKYIFHHTFSFPFYLNIA